jgi:hypothetical protein
MDCRVKPGNDGGEVFDGRGILTSLSHPKSGLPEFGILVWEMVAHAERMRACAG